MTEATLTLRQRVEAVIEMIRPAIQMDGGDLELVDVNEETGVVQVQMTGACVGCMMSNLTLRAGIERSIRQQVPEVTMVEAI